MRVFDFRCKPHYDKVPEALDQNRVWIGWCDDKQDKQLQKLMRRQLPFDVLLPEIKGLGYYSNPAESIALFISDEMSPGDILVVPRQIKGAYYVAEVAEERTRMVEIEMVKWRGYKGKVFARPVNWLLAKNPRPISTAPQSIRERFGKNYTCRDITDERGVRKWVLGLLKSDEEVWEAGRDAALAVQESHSGAGIQPSPAQRKKIEEYAMKRAYEYLMTKDFSEIQDTSARHPYDYECLNRKRVTYVEVKGTTGSARNIILTSGEKEHMRDHVKDSFLLIVRDIKLGKGQKPTVSGGEVKCLDCSKLLTRGKFRPTQYSVTLPI
ncbi:MAG: DUF3883 domain-containing protein [Terriglobia bacterium]|jgi:hypothetical protein